MDDRSPIAVASDLSERLGYNQPSFPIYCRHNRLSDYGYAAPAHWHADTEYLYVISGAMDFFVAGETVHLSPGTGIFVNSQRIHYGFSKERQECQFLAVIFDAGRWLPGVPAATAYWHTLTGFSRADYWLLTPTVSWQRQACTLIQAIYAQHKTLITAPLPVMAAALQLTDLLGQHLPQTVAGEDTAGPAERHAVWQMTDYIHRHFAEKVSLDQVAAAGAVSRSRGAELFKQHVGTTVMAYLNRYRVTRASELLRTTRQSVTEVSAACGFQTPSYFTYVFRQQVGMAPQAFRYARE